MALRETLVRLKRQQEDAVSFEAEKPRLKDEWIAAVSSLVEELKTFLAPFTVDGSLSVRDRTISLSEDMLGTYNVAAASIDAGPAKIELTPVARTVVGAVGRVDLARQGYQGSTQRILILRYEGKEPGARRWVLRMPVEVAATSGASIQTRQFDYELIPFDREGVERAIDYLLSL